MLLRSPSAPTAERARRGRERGRRRAALPPRLPPQLRARPRKECQRTAPPSRVQAARRMRKGVPWMPRARRGRGFRRAAAVATLVRRLTPRRRRGRAAGPALMRVRAQRVRKHSRRVRQDRQRSWRMLRRWWRGARCGLSPMRRGPGRAILMRRGPGRAIPMRRGPGRAMPMRRGPGRAIPMRRGPGRAMPMRWGPGRAMPMRRGPGRAMPTRMVRRWLPRRRAAASTCLWRLRCSCRGTLRATSEVRARALVAPARAPRARRLRSRGCGHVHAAARRHRRQRRVARAPRGRRGRVSCCTQSRRRRARGCAAVTGVSVIAAAARVAARRRRRRWGNA